MFDGNFIRDIKLKHLLVKLYLYKSILLFVQWEQNITFRLKYNKNIILMVVSFKHSLDPLEITSLFFPTNNNYTLN